MKNKLYRNYAYNTIYQVVILALPMILTPFVTRIIGVEGIGQYSYSRSIVTYFILFGTLGSNMYGQREIAYVSNDAEKRNRVFWEILTIRVLLLSLSLLVYCISQVQFGRYPFLFAIQVIDILAAGADITWFFQGLEQFEWLVKRNVLIKIMTAGAVLLFIRTPEDIWKYVLIYALGNLLGQLWLWKEAKVSWPERTREKGAYQKHLRELLYLFIPQLSIQIYLVIDKTMIELLTNDSAETGYYELAQTIQRTGVTIVTAFGAVASSRIASLRVKEEKEEIKQLIGRSMEIVCFLGLPITMGVGAVATNMIPWFMGSGYDTAVTLLIILCPLIFIIGMSNVSGIQYMIPMGMQKEMTISTIVGAVTNVILNAILITRHGAVGAAVASVVSELLVLLIQYYIIRHVILKKRIAGALFRCGTSSVMMFVAVEYAEKMLFVTPDIWNTMALIALGASVYISVMLMLQTVRKKFTLRGK